MKRLIRFVAKIYPRAWRNRYGEEFDALLDDTHANGRTALNVLTGAVGMQIQRLTKVALTALTAAVAIFAACWWAGQRTYISPGTHQIFHEDSNVGAMAGFLVFVAAAIAGLVALLGIPFRRATRAGWVCAGISIPYLLAVVLVSLLTPRTIVTVGDSYCWDLWCMGVQQVNSIPQGANTLYTAEVRVFCDSEHTHSVPAEAARRFLYVLDEQGRRFPLERFSSRLDPDLTVNPGETVKASLTFLAPSNAGKLYFAGDEGVMLPWVYMYFGTDVSLFHRRTLLSVL
jgi:hypothetical protein